MKNCIQKFYYGLLLCTMLQTSVTFTMEPMHVDQPSDTGSGKTFEQQQRELQEKLDSITRQKNDFQAKATQHQIYRQNLQNTTSQLSQLNAISLRDGTSLNQRARIGQNTINMQTDSYWTAFRKAQLKDVFSSPVFGKDPIHEAHKQAARTLIFGEDTDKTPDAATVEAAARKRLKAATENAHQLLLTETDPIRRQTIEQNLSQTRQSIDLASKFLSDKKHPGQSTRPDITSGIDAKYSEAIKNSALFNQDYDMGREINPATRIARAKTLLWGKDSQPSDLTAENIETKAQQLTALIEQNTRDLPFQQQEWIRNIENETIQHAKNLLLAEVAEKQAAQTRTTLSALNRQQELQQQTRSSTPTQRAVQSTTTTQSVATGLSPQEADQPEQASTTRSIEQKTVDFSSWDPAQKATLAAPPARPESKTEQATNNQPSKSFGDHATDVLNSVKRWVLSLFDFSKASYVGSITADAMTNDQTAINHIREEFSNPKTKALDFTKKQEIVKALQDEANEFYKKEEAKLKTKTNPNEGFQTKSQLEGHVITQFNQLVEAIKPMLTDSQKLLTTFENGKLIVKVVDLSTFQFNFESESPTAGRLHLFTLEQDDVPEPLKGQLRDELEQYAKDLPAKFERATGAEKTALAAQILGLDPKAATQAVEALSLIAQIKTHIAEVEKLQREYTKNQSGYYEDSFYDQANPHRIEINTLTRQLYKLLSQDVKNNPYFTEVGDEYTKEDDYTKDEDGFRSNRNWLESSRWIAFTEIKFSNALTLSCNSIDEDITRSLTAAMKPQRNASADLRYQARQTLLISADKK